MTFILSYRSFKEQKENALFLNRIKFNISYNHNTGLLGPIYKPKIYCEFVNYNLKNHIISPS